VEQCAAHQEGRGAGAGSTEGRRACVHVLSFHKRAMFTPPPGQPACLWCSRRDWTTRRGLRERNAACCCKRLSQRSARGTAGPAQPCLLKPALPRARAQLTPECMDLLNKIFVIDQNQRITVPNIKAHPWYTKPLLPKYEAAEAVLAKSQAEVDAYIANRQLNTVRPRPCARRAGRPAARGATSAQRQALRT